MFIIYYSMYKADRLHSTAAEAVAKNIEFLAPTKLAVLSDKTCSSFYLTFSD